MAGVTTTTALTDSTPTLLLSPNGSRLDAVITNSGNTRVYLGNDNTVSNRSALVELRPGEEFPFHDAAATLYAASYDVNAAAGQVSVLVTNPE